MSQPSFYCLLLKISKVLISDIIVISDKLNTDGYLGTVDIEKAKSLKTL